MARLFHSYIFVNYLKVMILRNCYSGLKSWYELPMRLFFIFSHYGHAHINFFTCEKFVSLFYFMLSSCNKGYDFITQTIQLVQFLSLFLCISEWSGESAEPTTPVSQLQWHIKVRAPRLLSFSLLPIFSYLQFWLEINCQEAEIFSEWILFGVDNVWYNIYVISCYEKDIPSASRERIKVCTQMAGS